MDFLPPGEMAHALPSMPLRELAPELAEGGRNRTARAKNIPAEADSSQDALVILQFFDYRNLVTLPELLHRVAREGVQSDVRGLELDAPRHILGAPQVHVHVEDPVRNEVLQFLLPDFGVSCGEHPVSRL